MPFEARKRMKWGPGRNPVQLEPGDEVPAPIKKVLLQNRHVAVVESIDGVKWSERPEEVQRAWAECNGISYLVEKRQGEAEPVTVASKSHASRLVEDESEAPPVSARRRRAPRLSSAVEPSPIAESAHEDEAEPDAPEEPVKRKRGRPRKFQE